MVFQQFWSRNSLQTGCGLSFLNILSPERNHFKMRVTAFFITWASVPGLTDTCTFTATNSARCPESPPGRRFYHFGQKKFGAVLRSAFKVDIHVGLKLRVFGIASASPPHPQQSTFDISIF